MRAISTTYRQSGTHWIMLSNRIKLIDFEATQNVNFSHMRDCLLVEVMTKKETPYALWQMECFIALKAARFFSGIS